MSFTCFDMDSFSHLYSSMLEYYDIHADEAAELLYTLYTAHLDAQSSYLPCRDHERAAFMKYLRKNQSQSYLTTVQLHKSMRALYNSIDSKRLSYKQRQAWEQLYMIMGEIEYEFLFDYGMEIDDERTVYDACEADLLPAQDEPAVCLKSEVVA